MKEDDLKLKAKEYVYWLIDYDKDLNQMSIPDAIQRGYEAGYFFECKIKNPILYTLIIFAVAFFLGALLTRGTLNTDELAKQQAKEEILQEIRTIIYETNL